MTTKSETKTQHNKCWTPLSRADPGGAPGAPLKIEKNKIRWRKIVIFTRNTPTFFAPPSAIGKNMNIWRKIVFFHTKYPKNFRASLHSAQFF